MSKRNGTLGYFIPEFPGQTHIFFWRELLAMRELGHDVQLISTRRADLGLVKHEFAEPAARETFYLHPPGAEALLYALSHPIWLCKALRYLVGLREGGLREKLRVLPFVVYAANLIAYCRRRSIDHVHGHSCANVAHILAMASLGDDLSYSLTLHGGLEVYGNNHPQKMQRATFVATVTRPLQAEVMQATGLSLERVPRISMGVDLSRFTYSDRTQEQSRPLRLVTIARLTPGKGHSFALKALHRLHQRGYDFDYAIVGGGEAQDDIQAEIDACGLSAKVRLLGTLSEDQVLETLRDSDVLLLTSYGMFEAAPVCVMEAMATGVPTLTSIIGGTRDMVDDGVNGLLVEQCNVDQIENALTTYLDDRSVVESFGRRAREKAEQHFDSREQARRLLEHIERQQAEADTGSLPSQLSAR